MKRNLTVLLLLCISVFRMDAQVNVITDDDVKQGTPCDQMKFCINYKMKYVNDTTRKPYVINTEPMLLEIGNKVSLFYSDACNKSDSVNSEILKRGERTFVCYGNISWRLYRGYPKTDTNTLLDKIGMERFVVTEKAEEPSWKICSDSATTVLGYACHLAITRFKSRLWSAWYTDEIPMSNGPWLLCGLPGLILKAYDAERQYTFEADGMKQIKDLDIYYKGEKYESIDRKALNNIYRQYYADPVGYVTNNPNLKVTVTDKNGNPTRGRMNIPYNSIER
nr:GLPGLI family protein [Prevotella sp.]